MGRRPNDGRGRLGGRTKGTPNKPKAPTPAWVEKMLRHTRPHIEALLNSQGDTLFYPRLLPALIVADAVGNLNATIREIAAASGVPLAPANLNPGQSGQTDGAV